MHALHNNQKKILEYLLDRPEGSTLEEIANHLGVTKTAAKEHILKVERLGFITYQDTKGFIGRPKRRYLLSDEGHEAFPRQYSWLSNVLLELLVDDMGNKGVQRIMSELAKKVSSSMGSRFNKSQPTATLLKEVTSTLNELGYRAVLRQSDIRKGAIIEATNCVYHSVAKQHPVLCNFDIKFLENATGMDVKLETCISRGDAVCRFCIRKNPASGV